jgi:tRNA pseudouridine65 synthase
LLDIIYRDDNYIAINKPSGLMVHKSPIARDVKEFALQTLRDQIGQRVYPCHRLDRPTSGVLLFALNSEAASRMGYLFENRLIEKKYLSFVRGWPKDSTGEINYPLCEDKGSDKEKKEAISFYGLLEKYEIDHSIDERFDKTRYSLLQLMPKTGRKHQLRRHLKHLNHPIIGDSKYGKAKHNNFFKEFYAFSRLALHCNILEFEHPYLEEKIKIEAPLAPDFKELLLQLRENQIK